MSGSLPSVSGSLLSVSVCLSVQAHCFLAKAAEDDFDMGAWYKELLELEALEQ